MKIKILLLSLFLLNIALAIEVDGIVATVGEKTILRSDVLNELHRSNLSEDFFKSARNQLIDRELIIQSAKDAKLTLQEWMIDNRVNEIVNNIFEGDRNKLIEHLTQIKVPFTEWRAHIKNDMLVSAMRWNIVDKNVVASPKEIREEYQNHPGLYQLDDEVSVSVILLTPENEGKRDEILEKLKTNDFASVAKEYSADSSAADGGVRMNVNAKKVFRPEVCDAISKLKIGETAPWIEMDGWYFLVRKDAEKEGKKPSFAEVYEAVEANVKAKNSEKLYNDWISRLKEETYIKIFE